MYTNKTMGAGKLSENLRPKKYCRKKRTRNWKESKLLSVIAIELYREEKKRSD